MATIVVKQLPLPLIDTSLPRPQFPDPYANTTFGADSSGTIVIENPITGAWDTATTEQLLQNIPNYCTDLKNVFPSMTNADGDIIDLRLLGETVLKVEADDVFLYRGHDDFTKPENSDTIVLANPLTHLLPNTEYLITIL